MMLGTLKTGVKWTIAGVLTAQAITLAGLGIVDRNRKRNRLHKPFPTGPVRQLPAGDDTVSIYTKGRDLYEDMLEAINAAQKTVLFETYIWKSDRVGRQFMEALSAAADRGVDVYVVYDVVGNLVVDPKFFTFNPRIKVVRHWPFTGIRGSVLTRAPGLNHRKVLVVDGHVGFLGGYNIGALYATRWRDTHLRVSGPAASDLENAFVDYWHQARRRGSVELPEPASRVWESAITVTRNVPSARVYPIRYMYLEAIDRARERLWLTHAYLIPDDDLMLALVEAADRGVDVRIIVPAESNHIVADWLSRGFYRQLLSRGVRLFLYQDAMVHAKTATADSTWSTIGTANLDRLSLSGNYELNISILDADIAAEMEQIFEMDSSNCVELTLEEWNRRPWAMKLSEAILAPLRPLL